MKNYNYLVMPSPIKEADAMRAQSTRQTPYLSLVMTNGVLDQSDSQLR